MLTRAAAARDAVRLCVVCQCDILAGDDAWDGACSHRLHRECAANYVREWRLNHVNSEPAPCPVCKVTGVFDPAHFPAGASEAEEQQRRASAARAEQERADRRLALELFDEDFGDFTFHRRAGLRQRELEAILWLSARVWATQ
jgi:hypothetical protein